MKLTTNFQLQEFIHPDIYERAGDRSFDFLCPMLPQTCQAIKDMCTEAMGVEVTVTINNWLWGGNFKNSGLRPPMHVPDKTEIITAMEDAKANKNFDTFIKLFQGVGALYSAHHFGTAADLKFSIKSGGKEILPTEVQRMILENKRKFPYVTRMENAEITRGWLHIECSSKKSTDINVFNP